jgi:hypothetical protein
VQPGLQQSIKNQNVRRAADLHPGLGYFKKTKPITETIVLSRWTTMNKKVYDYLLQNGKN